MINSVRIKTTDTPGVTEITADGWDGRILSMKRSVFQTWKERSKDVPETCVAYLIYANHFDKPSYGKKLYVGHTEDVLRRWAVHEREKDHWSMALILTSREDWMNVAHTKNVERIFIAWAKEANRYEVDNDNDGGSTHLGSDDIDRMNRFLEGVRPVLRMANIDVFEFNEDGYYTCDVKLGATRYTSRVAIATAGRDAGTLRVSPGSRFWIGRRDALDDVDVKDLLALGVATASFDSDHGVLTVHAAVVVPVRRHRSITWKLFGGPASQWTGVCGDPLNKALDRRVVETSDHGVAAPRIP